MVKLIAQNEFIYNKKGEIHLIEEQENGGGIGKSAELFHMADGTTLANAEWLVNHIEKIRRYAKSLEQVADRRIERLNEQSRKIDKLQRDLRKLKKAKK